MIENGVCTITYPRGIMQLRLSEFFPASSTVIRKLFTKTITLSEDRRKIKFEILKWLHDQLELLDAEASMKWYADKCVSCRTKAKEMQHVMDMQTAHVECLQGAIKNTRNREEKKIYREHLKVEAEKMKALKDLQKKMRSDAREYERLFVRIQQQEKKFKSNIELIEQITIGWFF